MSQLDAKAIIDSLANGIDPFTGEILEAGSLLNNPQVIRALFTAGGALEAAAKRAERKKRLPENAGRPWSDAESQDLVVNFDAGMGADQLAALFSRTKGSIAARLVRLGKIKERSDLTESPDAIP